MYKMETIAPCADYDGYTIEGYFMQQLSRNKLLNAAYNNLENVKYIESGNMIISKSNNYELYIYEENRFIISKVENPNTAEKLIETLLKKYSTQKDGNYETIY